MKETWERVKKMIERQTKEEERVLILNPIQRKKRDFGEKNDEKRASYLQRTLLELI